MYILSKTTNTEMRKHQRTVWKQGNNTNSGQKSGWNLKNTRYTVWMTQEKYTKKPFTSKQIMN